MSMLAMLAEISEWISGISWSDAGWGVLALVTSGGAYKGYKVIQRYIQRVKELKADNENWYEIGGDLLRAFQEDRAEIVATFGQLLALSKAASDKDSAIERVKANKAIFDKLLVGSGTPSPEAAQMLADLMVPVKAGIRVYSGTETDKLAKLKEAMEKDLGAQEAANKVLTNSGNVAALIAKLAIKLGPQILSGGKIDLEALLKAFQAQQAPKTADKVAEAIVSQPEPSEAK